MKTLEEYKKLITEKEQYVNHNKMVIEHFKKNNLKIDWHAIAVAQMHIDVIEK